MSNRYLLDTGVAGLAALYHPAIERKMAGVSPVYLPWASIGELYYGAYLYAHRNQSTKYLDIYDAFLLRMRRSLVRPNAETGQIYGAIRVELMAKGQPIQQNDIWIAALARQFGLTLATRDHDFERVSGLSVEFW